MMSRSCSTLRLHLCTCSASDCTDSSVLTPNQPVTIQTYKLAYAPIEDSDQPAHSRSLVRVFDGRSVGSQGSNVSSGCADAQTDLNLRCAHILCWLPAKKYSKRINVSRTERCILYNPY